MASKGSTVIVELRQFRSTIPSELLRKWEAPTGLRCFLDIAQDWALLLGGHQIFVRYPNPLTLIASLALMAWGQRGLSCLSHDSIHRNLVKSGKMNDVIADTFLAPPAMSTAKLQRHSHDMHHRYLGSEQDPDHGDHSETSLKHYRTGTYDHRNIFTLYLFDVLDPVLFYNNVMGSITEAPVHITLWWLIVSILTALLEPAASKPILHLAGFRISSFLILFHLARCTISYALYVFREIIDHSGLPSSSVLGFTRSSPWGTWFQKFIQPHDDNYHLLHHLLPKIPMSKLREADIWLKENSEAYRGAHHYESYFEENKGLLVQQLHEFQEI